MIAQDAYNILWADLAALKRRWLRYLTTTLISPLLYLVAFGWGLGRGINLNGTSYLEFVVPGIIALTAMTTSFNGAGTRLNVDRLYFRSFDECLMAPIKLHSLLLGKALIGVVRGIFSSVAFLALATLIAPSIHIGPMFLAGLLLTCLTFSFLGVLAALLAKSHEDMGTFGSIILLPMTFLGGTFFSLSQVPTGLKYSLYLLPLTHASTWLRAAALNQLLPWPSFLVLLIFLAAFVGGSMIAVRKMSI
ncbi:MAG TPA: ABC transporter permease [Methanotrichaceae archaeon]|nr:ABC transporter permease [Methanotrichaceae archaeon]HQF16141.1 ABC transporter permease [Methanotrichaceae archaeon]HQI90877.1 ABC transporter permease [Methanotrichaceae archaeon]HQJ28299.1 ABC transporter permease [Methanotrichaceae archaeon]